MDNVEVKGTLNRQALYDTVAAILTTKYRDTFHVKYKARLLKDGEKPSPGAEQLTPNWWAVRRCAK